MFKGTVKYKLQERQLEIPYEVYGYDTSTTCSLMLHGNGNTARKFMITSDLDEQLNDELLDDLPNDRRVNIDMAKVTVSTGKHKENDKMVKNKVNTLFFCQLAAVIRYAKSHCTKRNEKGYTGISLASKEFETRVETEYEIKYETEDKLLACLKLRLGCIVSLRIESPTLSITLEQDDSIADCLPKMVDGWTTGLKFNEDYLGFPLKEVETVEVTGIDGMYTCIEDIVKAHPDKEFSWLLQKDYRIVDDEHLEEICDYIMNWDGYVYYDTETTGLNINFMSRVGQADQLVGVVLSVKYGESFYFPLQMKSIKNLCNGDHWYVMEHYLRPILEGKELVAHNMSYDWKVGYIYDINCNIVHDTMALIKLTIGAEQLDYPMGLKENAKLLLGRDSLELSDLLVDNEWGDSDIKFWDLPYELVRLYACADTDNTNGLLQYAIQADLLTKYNAKKVYEIEIAFSYAVAYQEFYGHRIDVTNLSKVREQIGKEQEEYMGKMEEIVGHKFNPNSSPQLQQIMYTELGIPEQISRKTGRPTTDKETLKKLAELTDENDNPIYPFCCYLQKFREAEGVRKIVDKFPEHATKDGFIFSHVMQYGTTTGRVSINNPNYQSYNDPIKKNVVPRPGYWMFDTDYSSVEYRVLGNMVGNKRIMENFKDPDFDYHAYQAARMYGVPYSAVTKKMRKSAKGINFGLPYGMGDESLGVRIFGEPSEENTRKAAALRAAYFKGQEDIRDWFEYHRNKGVKEGFTETYFGRRRYYHKGKFTVGAIRRQAGNQVIQGCLDGNTRIQTKELGIIKLKDAVGYNYNIWDGKEWTTGDVLYSGKKQKCVVHFKGGLDIICSPIHKFLVRSAKGNDRFVECKDLLTLETTKNAHRVVINTNYEPSDYVYNSKEFYKYKSKVHNAHNVFLDNIKNSFDIGVMLGRLASDGSYGIREDGGSYITHYVAEHEYNILPELRSCMKTLGYKEDNRGIRKNRKEEMVKLSVFSNSLVKEIESLDIKHKVHKNIFMDTEVLRGFLSGFFDGDGGISGKTISLVFGTQYDFEPLILDLQKALLFFGIRSRYRKYDDRYVLAIKTTDNERFLDTIGFLNQDKQDKGRTLKCVEDEHTFGKCLLVESVEITDEYIDMYDVCNTDRGYYVADGVITHNTAADIYKTAVGRVFKRICREGWLGKVLFTGFIHDELLGECSNDINPGVFLKVLREEFEVKITNEDGTPWCPLYMGFGYGMSWYEAKSVELPIKLQWEIVDNYGETGFPYWTGDGRAFCDTVPDMLRDFSVRDIRNQLLDEDSQGKEIKPTLNNELIDCIKEDSELYTKGINEYCEKNSLKIEGISTHKQEIEEYLDKTYHIQNVLFDKDGNVVLEFKGSKETQECIDLFCRLHNVERTKINILNIAEVQAKEQTSEDSLILTVEEDDQSDYERKILGIQHQVNLVGLSLDVDDGKIYIKHVPQPAWGIISSYAKNKPSETEKAYKVIVVQPELDFKMTEVNAWINSTDITNLSQLYLTLANK